MAGASLAMAVVLGDPVLVVLAAPLAVCAAMGLVRVPTQRADRVAQPRPPHPARGSGHPLAPGPDARRRRRAGDPGHLAGAVRRPAPEHGLIGRLRAQGEDARAWSEPARWGPRPLGRREGRADDPVGRLPLGAGGADVVDAARRCRPSALRLARGDAAAAGPRRGAPLASGRQRHRVLRHPALPGGRPAAPHQLARLRCAPASCTSSAPAPSRTAAVLVVVDALADYGHSGGVDGEPSSLDLTVRGGSRARRALRPDRRPGAPPGDRRGRAGRSGTAPARGTCG